LRRMKMLIVLVACAYRIIRLKDKWLFHFHILLNQGDHLIQKGSLKWVLVSGW
jgi:hypothetical protein